MRKLESVGGILSLIQCTKLNSLGNLKYVGSMLYLDETEIQSLDNLEIVGGHLYLQYTKNLKSFGKLKYVGGLLALGESGILKLMSKEEIQRFIFIKEYITTSVKI